MLNLYPTALRMGGLYTPEIWGRGYVICHIEHSLFWGLNMQTRMHAWIPVKEARQKVEGCLVAQGEQCAVYDICCCILSERGGEMMQGKEVCHEFVNNKGAWIPLILERVVGIGYRDEYMGWGLERIRFQYFFSVLLGEGYMENCKCYDRNGV